MATGKPLPIPFPSSSFPGANPQEGAGRLINCYAEPLGEKSAISGQVWRRAPGLSPFARTSNSGYRGGLIVNNTSYETWSATAATVDASGNVTTLGAFPGSKFVSIARNRVSPNPDVVAVDADNGAYILNTTAVANASATATIGGSLGNNDTATIYFANSAAAGLLTQVTYKLGVSETATTVATALTTAINANTTLIANSVTATSAAGVITISQPGEIANQTQLSDGSTGGPRVTFSPASGFLSGGAGTPGINFTGTPLSYNGQGVMPAPNSVAFQDGYFIFTIGDGRVFNTDLNSLVMNALSYATVQSKADVTLLRGIPFNGLMYFFTTASCEIWNDAGNAPPAFPYNRYAVLETGLIQSAAIAGFETGFSELLWVDQDFGVQYAAPSTVAPPNKVSPPDLDRLIEQQVNAGALLEAGCYYFAGHKRWHLSSPAWTWEFNLRTGKWNERWSLQTSGIQGRWRAKGGHPAFGKFLVGDAQSGNMLFVDDQNYTEVGAPQLFRLESGVVAGFPASVRIARADFLFDMGVGQAVGNFTMTVTGAAAGTGGVVRLTVNDTSRAATHDVVMVSGVGGTIEANGTWPITVIDATHIELQGSTYANTYTAGGTVVDMTAPPQAVAPVVAISTSLDGGLNYGNPLIRSLGQQGRAKRARASVKNMGLSSPMGNRWRLDVSDPVYTGFLMATQSSDPREVGG
jgi:hypothetical protein